MEERKSDVIVSGRAAFEYNLGNLIFSFVALNIGFDLGVGMLWLYLVYHEQIQLIGAIAGGILFLLATAYAILLLSGIAKARRSKNTVEAIAKEDEFHVLVYKGEDLAKEYHVAYQKALYYRISRHYIFVYMAKQNAFPIQKKDEWVEFLNARGIRKK